MIKVIQLNWEESDKTGWLGASTPFGVLNIYHDKEAGKYYTGSDNYPYIGDTFSTLEEAKQDLQRWFENLVRIVLKTCIVDEVSD